MVDAETIDASARQDAAEQKMEDRYRLAIDALLCDGVFDSDDAGVLEGFRAHLGVAPERADAIFRDQARSYIRQRMLRFLEDLVASVGLGPQWGEETELALADARRTWALASGPLPQIATDVGLVGEEVAYLSVRVSAFEERSRMVGMSFGGLALSIPIFKGLRFRGGHYGVSRQAMDYQHRLGDGELTITSRRLIFRSPERAITARLTSIVDLTNYTDGVAVQRTTGKPVTSVLDAPDEDFALILWRAWQETRGVSGEAG